METPEEKFESNWASKYVDNHTKVKNKILNALRLGDSSSILDGIGAAKNLLSNSATNSIIEQGFKEYVDLIGFGNKNLGFKIIEDIQGIFSKLNQSDFKIQEADKKRIITYALSVIGQYHSISELFDRIKKLTEIGMQFSHEEMRQLLIPGIVYQQHKKDVYGVGQSDVDKLMKQVNNELMNMGIIFNESDYNKIDFYRKMIGCYEEISRFERAKKMIHEYWNNIEKEKIRLDIKKNLSE